mmetsp:Transcript_120506/g.239859  ORF Transcript_120506/g.239859 Transcript_120506/m.239859 type:complete len:333 (-) Transcript_120506:56-1054(-)
MADAGWPSSSPPAGMVDVLREWPGLHRPYHLDVQQFLDALGISPLAPPPVLEVAKRAHLTPYPPHWTEQLDTASGALYFYHDTLDESSWVHPLNETFREVLGFVALSVSERIAVGVLATRIEEVLAEDQQKATTALTEWVGPIDSGESAYFYNQSTGQSQWDDPREGWRYDLHVRYDLLVGFLVAEERRESKRLDQLTLQTPDLTPTLTSLASSMSSMASALNTAVSEPTGPAEDGDAEVFWAQPRPRRAAGTLPLPPRAMGTQRAVFSMPPHQQRYAANVLQQSSPQQQEDAPFYQGRRRSTSPSRGVFPGLLPERPPPPPPDAPLRAGQK